MAVYYSQGSGNWSTLANWNTNAGGGGSSPASVADMDDDTFVVQAGHAICFDVDTSGFANGLAGLTISGSAGTPGMLYPKYDADGNYYLKLKTGTTIAGTNAANYGRLLANSDGVWGNTGALPFGRKFIIALVNTAYIDSTYIRIALYDTEPSHTSVATYGALHIVAASAAADTLTKASHGLTDNTPIMFRVTGGALPAPLTSEDVYYVRNAATNTFKVAPVSGGLAIDLTTDGSGTIEVYTGHTNTGTATMNVLDDVSGDPQWLDGANVALVNANQPNNADIQRVLLVGVPLAGSVTLSANVDSAQWPGARIWLLQRNVAIRGSATTTVGMVQGSVGGTFQCEIRATAGTGYSFYQNALSGGGSGNIISGVISGCVAGTYGGRGHTISGAVIACSAGSQYVIDLVVTGHISGCNYDVRDGVNSVVSGTLSGSNYGFLYGTRNRLTETGTIYGCNSGCHSGTGHEYAGLIRGCGTGVDSGIGILISGSLRGHSTGVSLSVRCVLSGAIRWCNLGWTGEGIISGSITDCQYTAAFSSTGLVRAVVTSGVTVLPPTINNRDSRMGGRATAHGVIYENYNGVFGASYAFLANGDVIKNTAELRTGGATSSIEGVPLSFCDTVRWLPLFEWTEVNVPASAQTRTVYIKGNASWSPVPLDTELWIEAEYYDSAVALTRATVHSYDTAQGDRVLDGTNWTAYTLTFTPGRAGAVRYRGYLAKYQSGAKVYVDNMLVTS